MNQEDRGGGWGQVSQKGETEGKRVERDGNNYVKYIWEQVKRAMVENAREVCGSVRVGERTQRMCGGTMR